MKEKNKTFVLSVGGSLILNSQGPDLVFLKKFRSFILDKIANGFRFYLVVGGGLIARTYVNSAVFLGPVNNRDRDLIGIKATHLNAELLRVILGPEITYQEIITNPKKIIKTSKPIIIAAGFKPGRSTDYVAVMLAREYKIKTLLNLSNIDYVYDRDPKLFPQAGKIKDLSWSKFQSIVGHKWRPGSNLPFDPVASSLAAQENLEVIIINGQKLKNLEHCLLQEKFIGTKIHS